MGAFVSKTNISGSSEKVNKIKSEVTCIKCEKTDHFINRKSNIDTKEEKQKRNKNSKQLILIGFSDCTKGYGLYNPNEKKVNVRRDAIRRNFGITNADASGKFLITGINRFRNGSNKPNKVDHRAVLVKENHNIMNSLENHYSHHCQKENN
ncbi:hypothetical protein WA026_012663 [Henosepilachna vigintioctopunctata]|uniref:Retroviral polymerase SH3-like domain-containing protein n=1 Tax=Henosepilachna vigintioctopunctata TaxID=420089 RepID=A0AAW1U6R0_9CUCU